MGEIAVDHGLLKQVDHNVRVAINGINAVNGQVVVLQGNLARAQERIKQLRAYVEEMRREQRNAAALQRAISEIIRVRQELEQKFGKYQEVRDSMIGILQANDNALVGADTIVRVAEELMIATPRYWLAPCVIAISAWIADKQDIAKQAVEEALSRDPEKTALLMALICRRTAAVSANSTSSNIDKIQRDRLDASQEWLAFYFKCQDPNNISRSVLLFVNAYVNGVFGEDTSGTVDDFIQNKWLKSLAEANPNFKNEQIATWNSLFTNTMNSSGVPATKKYPTLAKYADKQDFENIAAYADRVDISENFIEGYFININNQSVDTARLVEIIDEYLSSLVTDFDEAERGLREEEEKFQTIKDCEGDCDVADAVMARKRAKKAHLNEPVSLIQYLHSAVAGNNEDDGVEHDVSEKKTALKFTKPYIQESYNNFMDEKKDKFPTEVKATVEGVKHTVRSDADAAPFSNKVKAQLEKERDEKKAAAKPKIILPIILAILGVIFMFIPNALPVGIIGIVVGVVMYVAARNGAKKKKLAIDADYEKRINAALADVKAIVKEWDTVSSNVARFNSKPRFDVGNVK